VFANTDHITKNDHRIKLYTDQYPGSLLLESR
jgi:hypothetical protein